MPGSNSYPQTGDISTVKRQNIISDMKRIVANPASLPGLRNKVQTRQFLRWYRFSTSMLGDEHSELQQLKKFVSGFIACNKDFGRPISD